MNDHDRNNVNFIMTLDDTQFDNWAENMSNDDIKYAIEIIQAARLELAEQENALMEAELEESTLDEARAVLKKFML